MKIRVIPGVAFYVFFRWRYSPLRALACRTIPLHFSLSITNSLHLFTPSTWRFLPNSSLHPFLGLPLRLVPSSSWVKIFLGILSSSILSRWRGQLILCPFIHFTIFSPLLNSSSSRFVLLFHSPSSYLGPYILLNIFLSKISRACSSYFVIVHVSAPYVSTGYQVSPEHFNPLNAELNPIFYLLALLAHHFLHVSRIRVKSLTIRLLMSYIYGAPILDVSRSHTTTQHSR